MSFRYAPGLDWAPLVEGRADLHFWGLEVPAPMMASAGSTEKITLQQSWSSPEWGKNDFTGWAMPLTGTLVQSGAFKVRSLKVYNGYMNHMLEAVLFMPSARPNILLAMPDVLPVKDMELLGQEGKGQAGVRKILQSHHLWWVPAIFPYCPSAPDPAACDTGRQPASQIHNGVVVSRLIPDRDDWVVVADGKVWNLGKERTLSAGGKNFELVPVASEPGMLELKLSK